MSNDISKTGAMEGSVVGVPIDDEVHIGYEDSYKSKNLMMNPMVSQPNPNYGRGSVKGNYGYEGGNYGNNNGGEMRVPPPPPRNDAVSALEYYNGAEHSY